MDLREYLAQQQQLVDSELDRLVPPETTPPETIHRAMRYSLFAGGKRIRPILCIEAARTITSECSGILPAACSLELIHTYSLIHDDLPALDNDDYRRGKLTNHKVFGDAMALLAGDSLLTLAFQVLAQLDASYCVPLAPAAVAPIRSDARSSAPVLARWMVSSSSAPGGLPSPSRSATCPPIIPPTVPLATASSAIRRARMQSGASNWANTWKANVNKESPASIAMASPKTL